MSHLTDNRAHWYVGSPFTYLIAVDGVSAGQLSDLAWRLVGHGEVDAGIQVATDGDATNVAVPVAADVTSGLRFGSYRWQLVGNVDGNGPQVLARGRLTLSLIGSAGPNE